MRHKALSAFFVGFSWGLMTAASGHSYHSPLVVCLSLLSLVAGFVTADFSGPRDPSRSLELLELAREAVAQFAALPVDEDPDGLARMLGYLDRAAAIRHPDK